MHAISKRKLTDKLLERIVLSDDPADFAKTKFILRTKELQALIKAAIGTSQLTVLIESHLFKLSKKFDDLLRPLVELTLIDAKEAVVQGNGVLTRQQEVYDFLVALKSNYLVKTVLWC